MCDKIKKILIIAILLCAVTSPAHANAGIPMIFLTLPAMLMALIPVILIESFYLYKHGVEWKLAVKWVKIGNVVTTVIGMPCTWFVLVIIQMTVGKILYDIGALDVSIFWQQVLSVTIGAPWMMDADPEYRWMISVGALFLLIPFFWMSYWLETIILRYGIKTISHSRIRELCFHANLITYGLLALIPLGFLIFGWPE